tara:strand:- start:56 stop:472 length:417 start_codon:yes stop_codon:yes gene_type:complete
MSIEQVVIDAGGPIQTVNLNQGPAGNSILGAEFISSETAIPATETEVVLTHGLGAVPKSFQWVLRCKNTSGGEGYAVGDEIDVLTNSNPAANLTVYANSTSCVFSYTLQLEYALKGSSGEWACTNADTNWKLICRAFA